MNLYDLLKLVDEDTCFFVITEDGYIINQANVDNLSELVNDIGPDKSLKQLQVFFVIE